MLLGFSLFMTCFAFQLPDVLDESKLKKMILLLEKRLLKNQEMRIKFADTPEK